MTLYQMRFLALTMISSEIIGGITLPRGTREGRFYPLLILTITQNSDSNIPHDSVVLRKSRRRASRSHQVRNKEAQRCAKETQVCPRKTRWDHS